MSNDNSSPKYNLRKRKKKIYIDPNDCKSDDDSSSDYNPNEDKGELEILKYISQRFPNKYGKKNLKNNTIKIDKKNNKKNNIKKNEIKKAKKFFNCLNNLNEKKKIKKEKKEHEKDKNEEEKYNDVIIFDNYKNNNGKTYKLLLNFPDDSFIYDNYNDQSCFNEMYNDENVKNSDSSDDEEKKNKSLKIGEKVKIKLDDWDTFYTGKIIKIRKNGHYNIKLDDDMFGIIKDVSIKYISSIEKEEDHKILLKELKILSEASDNKKLKEKFEKLTSAYEEEEKKKELKKNNTKKKKNVNIFRNLLKEKSKFNDIKYFNSLDLDEQNKIIQNLKEINEYNKVKKPYRILLIEKNMPNIYKALALKKVTSFNNMDPCNSEYYKLKNWIDGFMEIPFGNYCKLPLQISDGVDKCSEFLDKSKKILDDCVYGLENAKMQLLQYIGQWLVNPNTIGTAIAIKGPPGTGKTTLIKEGISKILNRPFGFITLGGATDSSFLEGHSYTYEGSVWGKVVDILIRSKCMNPIIFMDELDKISDSPKGEEITGILTHLTDTTQNDKFHDKYFSTLDFNLSKTLFIFSYNDESKINPILKDRLYRVQTEGFTKNDKLIIAKKYIIPKIEKNLKFEENNIQFDDDTINYIIEKFTENEKGVRNLKRCFEIIFTKINLFRLSKKKNYLFKDKDYLEIKFPFKVTKKVIDKVIIKSKINECCINMYI